MREPPGELGLAPSFATSLTRWRGHLRSMGMLVGVLIVLNCFGVGLAGGDCGVFQYRHAVVPGGD